MLGWREIDFALICEASKIHPDFSKMEQLIDAGADVNAVRGDYENALSVIIGGFERCDCVETSSEKDSLPEVIEFFIKHGFDPERQIGKEWRKGMVGATCLVNLPLARCHATMIPAMRLLLDAGCRAIKVNNPKYYGRFRHYNWNVCEAAALRIVQSREDKGGDRSRGCRKGYRKAGRGYRKGYRKVRRGYRKTERDG